MQEQLALTAQRRAELHDEKGRSGKTFIKDPMVRELDGLKAEHEFGKVSGLMPDLSEKPNGDGGLDFIINVNYGVDVKASRNPGNLIVAADKVWADIYVLYDSSESWPFPCPLGWMWGSRMKRQPKSDFGQKVPPAHYMAAKDLIPFESLVRMMRKHKNV